MTSPNAVGLCTACNNTNGRHCARCKSARYCSTACQKADWPTHKLLCPTFSAFDASNQTTHEHFRAILFPADEEKPRYIWLHCKWHSDEDGSSNQYPETGPFLGLGLSMVPIQYNQVQKRNLSDTIYVCYRDTFLIDGSIPSKSVAAITATKPGQFHDWRGPIIVFGKVGLGIDPVKCKDIDMNDFRHVVDYFLSYNYTPAPANQQSTDIRVKGVRINCIGDEKLCNKSHFEGVEIPFTDSIFSYPDTSDIAERIGLPILTRRCPANPRWVNDQDNVIFKPGSPFNNPDATFLHLCCDPRADFDRRTGTLGWAWASQQWQNDVGSVIVVRQDRKPLFPLHVEALCKYCIHDIRPLLAHSIGEYDPEKPMEKDAVLAMICRPTFVICWYKLLDEKHQSGEDSSAPYPYD